MGNDAKIEESDVKLLETIKKTLDEDGKNLIVKRIRGRLVIYHETVKRIDDFKY